MLNARWRGAKLCSRKNVIFAKNSGCGFGNSADIWRSSLANVFDILFVLLMRNNNIDSDPGGRCYNSVGEGPNYVHVKT